ncbi:acylphosphatase [Nafulsella turpanensis]|uniref:acylphosphatase n=1 Tax=Nafulsella turpanensis TaxID=1265690 RepID=UPI0003495C24|nr:acylphosphatase [Nafulsella turpanensis]
MIRYRIKVKGKVQGVFYRASTQAMAKELGLNGWVANEEDGSVLIEAEGEELKLDKLLEWCRQGPGAAIVNEVVHEEIEPKASGGFEIRQ